MEDRSSISENLWSFFFTFILMMHCRWYHDSVGSEKEAMQKRYSIVICMISSHVWKFGVQLLWEVEEVSKNPWVLAFRTRVSVCIAYNQSCVVVHKVVHSFPVVHKDWLYPFQTPCCAFWHISASLFEGSGFRFCTQAINMTQKFDFLQ
jgi:hypothetical protein